MARERPTLLQLVEQAASEMESRLPGVDSRLRRSNVAVIARVLASLVHGLYGYVAYLERQMMPDTAEGTYLERHAAEVGIYRLPPAKADGVILVTGVVGAEVPLGTLFRREDGARYAATSSYRIVANVTGGPTVEAQVAGADGNMTSGIGISLDSPVAGVSADAKTGAGGLTNGSDTEGDEALRARMLERKRNPPMGGTRKDYEVWARAAHPAVTRAWCTTSTDGLAAGQVMVRFVTDNSSSPVPTADVMAAVNQYISERMPITATLVLPTLTAVPLNLTIAPVYTANAGLAREAIAAELAATIRRDGTPLNGPIKLSRLSEAVSAAAGEYAHVISSPTQDVFPGADRIFVLGTITWTN